MFGSSHLGLLDITLFSVMTVLLAGAGVWMVFFIRRFRDQRLRTIAPQSSMWAAVEFQVLNSAGYLELNRIFGVLLLVLAGALIDFMLSGAHFG
jgi:hypothetical protein